MSTIKLAAADKCSGDSTANDVTDAINEIEEMDIIGNYVKSLLGNNPGETFCSIGASVPLAGSVAKRSCSCAFYQGCSETTYEDMGASLTYGYCKIMWYDYAAMGGAGLFVLLALSSLFKRYRNRQVMQGQMNQVLLHNQAPMPYQALPQPGNEPGKCLPPGWRVDVDPNSGGTYYTSPQGVTQWECPN